jgi:hypothetical protein
VEDYKYDLGPELNFGRWQDRERYYIKFYCTFTHREIGYNLTEGGDGGNGHNFKRKGIHYSDKMRKQYSDAGKRAIALLTPEERKHIFGDAKRGTKDSLETKQRKSDAATGKIKTKTHCNNISRAKKGKKIGPFTQDHKNNMSKSAKGKKKSDTHCKNISIARKKYYQEHPEAKEEQRQYWKQLREMKLLLIKNSFLKVFSENL